MMDLFTAVAGVIANKKQNRIRPLSMYRLKHINNKRMIFLRIESANMTDNQLIGQS